MRRWLIGSFVLLLTTAACTTERDESTANASLIDTTTPALITTTSKVTTTTVAASETTSPPPTVPGAEPIIAAPVDSVIVETALGRMNWQRFDLSHLITHVEPFGDGYVGIAYQKTSHRPEYNGGIAGPGYVVTSSDGVEWDHLSDQPAPVETFAPSVLNVEGDHIFVAGRVVEDGLVQLGVLVAHEYDGTAWSELSVDPAEDGFAGTGGSLDIARTSEASTKIRGGNNGLQPAGYWTHDGSMTFSTDPADVWPIEWPRSDAVPVWPLQDGFISPVEISGPIVMRGDRFVVVSWMGGDGEAWTSSDGATWHEIDPIVAPWPGDPDPGHVVAPEILDAGGLGWLAVGSFGAPSVIWLSSDGVVWNTLDGVVAPGPTDLLVPWPPPSTVVDDGQILVYGRSPIERPADDDSGYALPPPSTPMLWVGQLVDG